MKTTTILGLIAIAVFAVPILGQKAPTFEQYAARVEKAGKINVNLASHRNARTYRTNLREAAKSGVNFAGHYVVAEWGCGTNCMQAGIVDARNGKAYFPIELEGMSSGACDIPDETELTEYKPNSRLLILSGHRGNDANKMQRACGVYYYEWTGTKLRLIKPVPKKRTDG